MDNASSLPEPSPHARSSAQWHLPMPSAPKYPIEEDIVYDGGIKVVTTVAASPAAPPAWKVAEYFTLWKIAAIVVFIVGYDLGWAHFEALWRAWAWESN